MSGCSHDQTDSVRDLGHALGFDFDLMRCALCRAYLVHVAGVAPSITLFVTDFEAQAFLTCPADRLKSLVKAWWEGRE